MILGLPMPSINRSQCLVLSLGTDACHQSRCWLVPDGLSRKDDIDDRT
jgi:hypothetical protein